MQQRGKKKKKSYGAVVLPGILASACDRSPATASPHSAGSTGALPGEAGIPELPATPRTLTRADGFPGANLYLSPQGLRSWHGVSET